MLPRRAVLLAGAAAGLAGCSASPPLVIWPGARPEGTLHEVFFATSRRPDPATGLPLSSPDERLWRGAAIVSVPPTHRPGQVEWPTRNPDPARQFLVRDYEIGLHAAAFRRRLARRLRRTGGEAVLFVHGYNTSFPEGLYRFVQIMHDYDVRATAVHYSWPSVANPLGYTADRDRALFARDGLEALLQELVAAGARRVLLVAHSLGAFLSMEVLRQLAIGGRRAVLARLGGVVLLSPDIDVSLFRVQVRRIGRLPQPFVILVNRRDRALRLAALITGESDRLGNLRDSRRLADLEVTLVDATALSGGDPAGHFIAATSPTAISVLRRLREMSSAFEADRAAALGALPATILTIRHATEIVLRPVVR